MSRELSSKGGSTTVETIIWLPVWVLVLFLIIQGGMIVYSQIIVIGAAREGARAAVVSASPISSAKEAAGSYARYLPGASGGLAVEVNSAEQFRPGSELTVEVSYTLPLLFPRLYSSLKGEAAAGIKLAARSSMLVEHQE